MERYSNGPDCVKRKLEVISIKLTQKTDPTEGIPHMFGNGGLTNLQEFARAKEAIRNDGRRRLVEKWQKRWHGDQSGRWTHHLIPELATWLDRAKQLGPYHNRIQISVA